MHGARSSVILEGIGACAAFRSGINHKHTKQVNHLPPPKTNKTAVRTALLTSVVRSVFVGTASIVNIEWYISCLARFVSFFFISLVMVTTVLRSDDRVSTSASSECG